MRVCQWVRGQPILRKAPNFFAAPIRAPAGQVFLTGWVIRTPPSSQLGARKWRADLMVVLLAGDAIKPWQRVSLCHGSKSQKLER